MHIDIYNNIRIQFSIRDILENLCDDSRINFVKATLNLLFKLCLKW